jgi:hypothetical protein
MKHIHIVLSLIATVVLAACSTDASVPTNAVVSNEQANIYPDYRDVYIPQNIAPLNFRADNEGDARIASVKGKKGELVVEADANGVLAFDTAQWHRLLDENAGDSLTVTLYTHRNGEWLEHPKFQLHVAEPIDRYLSYRLIEPSYELYRQLGIYQRNLTNFTQTPIYENNRSFSDDDNHCINCHNYQNYGTQRMLFHVRAKHGGTVVVDNGKVRKFNMKTDSVPSTTYPAWHPTRPWVVFSSNQTGQVFHMTDHQKVEVVDFGSDLAFFDAEKGTLKRLTNTPETLETFPTFSPDGKRLFYCSAYVKQFKGLDSKKREDRVSQIADSIRYNLMSMSFDEATQTFGSPQVEMRCDSIGKSATVPRVSPDGRYLLFTLADYGQFHIWHTSADLYVKDLQTGEVRPLKAANSPRAESYHAWSSNGRWIVVASRRDDGNYSRAYIAYFDRNGRDHKAFLLPQEDPNQNTLLLKSYNVPELTRTPVAVSPEDLKKVIYDDQHTVNATNK